MSYVLYFKRQFGRTFMLAAALTLAALLSAVTPARAMQKTAALSNTCTELPDGLISWWTADGTAEDFQGNHDGVLMNGAAYGKGVMGSAFTFDGVDDYVRLPEDFFPYPNVGEGNQPFTFSVWFKTNGTGIIFGQNRVDGQPGGSLPSGWVPGLYVGTDGKLRAEIFWGGIIQPYESPAAVNDGLFHHVAVTHEGSAQFQAVYLDGQRLVRRRHTQLGHGTPDTPYKYQFGTGYTRNWPGTNNHWFYFAGSLDEIQLYDRALSDAEILSLFNAREGGYCSYVISGRVTDVCGKGLAAVRISLTDGESAPQRTAFTDADGFYRFDRVERGRDYRVYAPADVSYSPARYFFENLSGNITADFKDLTPVLWCPPLN